MVTPGSIPYPTFTLLAAATISFFTRASKRLSFSPEAKERLLSHDWPGNIRELKKFVDLLVAGHEGRVTGDAARKLLTTASLPAGLFSVVARVEKNRLLNIRLVLSKSYVPEQLGLSADRRELGVLVSDLAAR